MSFGSASERPGPGIIAPPPVLFLAPLLGGLLLDRVVPLPRLPGAVRWAGSPLLAAGLVLGGWFFATMRRAGTPVDPYQAPTALVDAGPFRFTRNPAYLGMGLAYIGATLLAGGRWPLVFLPGVLATVHQGVIVREEEYLERRFKGSYAAYRARVRRWL